MKSQLGRHSMILAVVITLWATGLAIAEERIVRRFDVAQNGATFKAVAFDGDGVFDTVTDDGNPAQGAVFSVLGYIYPRGTLQGGAVSGTLDDGSPAFPDQVLGIWSCRGWFVLDGDPGIEGVQLLGSQVWEFSADGPYGKRTIVTDGVDLSLEDVDLNVPFKRAITGGTGRFRGARGEQTMVNYGFNASFGFDSTHRLVMEVMD